MDIAHDLEQDFIQQTFKQLSSAKHTSYKGKNKQRLFRFNIFEDVGTRRKEFLEQKLLRILYSLGQELNDCIKESNQSPLVVDRKNVSNYFYDEHGVIYLRPRKSIKFSSMLKRRQAFLLHLIVKAIKLIERDKYISKRELYYHSLNHCLVSSRNSRVSTSQSQQQLSQSQQPASQSQHSTTHPQFRHNPTKLEAIIDDLCCLVGCSRVHLRILTQTKGVVYGNLKFKLKSGEVFDCLMKKEGVTLPTAQEPIIHVESEAKFILVIEKDCVLQKILNQEDKTNFVRDYKVILFTAKGYPDITSRAFLNFLSTKLSIPLLAITDADPHGLEIVCCYKFGGYSTAYEAPYVVMPHIKWLGLLPNDVKKLGIEDSRTLPLTPNDIKKINSLLSRPYLENNLSWIRQLNIMREMGRKAELESIDETGEYLVGTYLPNKLRYASWL